MSVDGGSPDARLYEITWFKNFAYRERATVMLTMMKLPVNSYFPADYRTLEELKRPEQPSTTTEQKDREGSP
jgi:hypothetical protein